MSLQLSREIEFQQNDMDLAHRDAGGAGDLVDIDRARSKRADDPLPLALRDFGQGFRRYAFLRGGQLRAERFDRAPKDRRQSFDDVAGAGDEAGALLEQIVGAGGARVERAARHGKDLAALLAGKAGGDQRA